MMSTPIIVIILRIVVTVRAIINRLMIKYFLSYL